MTQNLELHIICVKEFAKYSFCSPKFFPKEKTFLNANIICNFKNPLVSREQLNKQGATW